MACFNDPRSTHILKMSLLLLMLMWVALLLADAKHHHHHHHVPKAWTKELRSTAMNEYLLKRISDMSRRTIHKFLHYLKKGSLSSHSDAFCGAARMVCESDAGVPRETVSPSFYTDASPQLKRVYFQKTDILVGEGVSFQDVTNGLPFRAFLPQKLANKLPFSTHTLPRLLDVLSIPPNSDLAKEMEQSLATCEGSTWVGKGHKCVRSLEEMVHFIAHNLGPDLDILQPTLHPGAERQNLTIRDIALKGSPRSHETVICSELMFSSLVLHCHVAEDVESIEVTVESQEEKEVYRGVMQCSKNGGDSITSHVRETCHWSGVNELVFVREVEAKEGKKEKKKKKEGEKRVEAKEKKEAEVEEKKAEEEREEKRVEEEEEGKERKEGMAEEEKGMAREEGIAEEEKVMGRAEEEKEKGMARAEEEEEKKGIMAREEGMGEKEEEGMGEKEEEKGMARAQKEEKKGMAREEGMGEKEEEKKGIMAREEGMGEKEEKKGIMGREEGMGEKEEEQGMERRRGEVVSPQWVP